MKKLLLLATLSGLLAISGLSQTANYWSASNASRNSIVADKATTRQSFPKEVKLFTLNTDPLRQALFAAVNTPQSSGRSAIISLPNAAGRLEDFEVYEASNFEPALQARFPEIRSFSGKGITDKAATLKLSISPQGIQTMVFRIEKENEFIEPYSQDHTVYAVFASQREKGSLPWTCTTVDEQLATNLNQQISNTDNPARSGGNLKTMRLAQSVTAEYSNFFGATSAAQVNLVLAAINNTLARCNGVYEKDLALHLNLVAASTNVIYYNPATDPYSPASSGAGGAWNTELQNTLTSVIGEANYDIGHLFGATGGGGNAGCIGCICVNGSKGRGFTSPADAIPQGDNFDIDYVAHEVGHQLGGNHTYSHVNEGTGVNKEVGSGITIMGYAGITAQDVAPHSIDIFHEASIAQIQTNLAAKTCPVTTTITNATPVVAPVSNYTIPRSTPFALTGAATDANTSDVLTYCWEQNDNATQTGANSVASPTKVTGPNWLSFQPTTSPTRYCPQLATILAGGQVTGPLPGGDAGANIEALSSVARTLNFRLTVRDNAPYRSTAPVSVGQTDFTDMVVTVDASSGPFAITAPNTAVTWVGGSSQTITWDVAGTTAAPVSCANVKISLSTDGGQTFPTVLAASTPNDGTQAVAIPNTPSTTARIKVEAVGNIFFDISNSNFTITAAPLPNLTITDVTQNEGNSGTTAFTFTVNLSSPAPAGGVSFNVATANGTATAGSDYIALNTTGTIAAGSSSTTIVVIVNGDVTFEGNETFTVNITSPTNAVITDGQGLGTITNDDALPNLTITDVTQVEGNSGTSAFTFTVNLSSPAPAGGVTFNVATANGTATAGTDYVALNTTGSIAAGSSSTTVVVLVNGDVTVEPNETFTVNITSPTNAVITDGQGVGTITNDDAAPLPNLTITDVTQVEGNSGTSAFTFTVNLSSPAPAGGVTFNVATANGTATAGSDYVAVNTTGSIAAGSSSTTVVVTVNGDVTVEPNETFTVNITSPTNAVITDGQGLGTITNDDAAPLPNLTINDITLNEGNSGTTSFTFTVNLSAPAPAGGVTFNVATANGTATAGTDYVALNTTGSIAAGSSSTTVVVTVNGDVTVEANETFFVNITSPTNAVITDGQGLGTITNDDTNPCTTDATPPTIVLKPNPTVFLTAANTYTVQLSDVLQSVSDNCDPNPGATVSNLQVTCANLGSGTGTPHQAYVSNRSTGNANYDGQFGLTFRVNSASGVVIDKLGVFDDQSNGTGITGNQSGGVRVAIFNQNTQALVTGLDVTIVGTTDPLVGNYRVRSITPVTLPAGNYVIVTKGYVGEKFYNRNQAGALNPAGDNASGALTFLNTVYYGTSATFGFPAGSTDAGNPNEYIAGTFNYSLGTGNAVTVTATDVSGNTSTATTSVTVADTFYVLTTKNATVNLNASGQATIVPADVLQSLKNNCGVDVTTSTFQVSPSTFTCADYSAGSGTSHQAYISDKTVGNANYDGQFGLTFKVNSANGIIIDKLGAFDDQSNGTGITGSEGGGVRVAIFNQNTQALVTGLDVTIVGTSDPLIGSYRVRTLATPVTLPAGNYVIVTKGYVGEKFYNRNQTGPLNPAGDNAAGALTFLNTVYYGSSASFSFPAGSGDAGNPNEYIAGTFNYSLSTGGGGTPHQAYVSDKTVGNANYDGQFGLTFKVNSANGIIIDKLGVFDDQSNGTGITGNQSGGVRVAIFNQNTQAMVSGLDVTIAGTADPLVGNYRVRTLATPVTLPAGNYVIVTKGYVGEKFYNRNQTGPLNPVGDNAGGALTFLNTVYYGSSATFIFPAGSGDAGNPNEYIAGTFSYALNVSNNKIVTVTATDTYGNVTNATATVTLTNTSGSCTPAPAPVMTYAAKSQQTDVPVILDNVSMTVKVYPNPSSGQFTVQLLNLKVPKVALQIMDANGQVVVQKEVMATGKTPLLSIPVDISKHAAGIYVIKVISADGIQTTKVVVSR